MNHEKKLEENGITVRVVLVLTGLLRQLRNVDLRC
jgi:hypothetical protein